MSDELPRVVVDLRLTRRSFMALQALYLDRVDAAERCLSDLDLAVLRRLGEVADVLSTLAFRLAGPRDESLSVPFARSEEMPRPVERVVEVIDLGDPLLFQDIPDRDAKEES